jgi:hypothetical protein
MTDTTEVLERIAADEEIIDSLRYWVDTVAVATELAEFDLGRAHSMINLIESQ